MSIRTLHRLPVVELQLAFPAAQEEAAQGGLEDVLGVFLAGEAVGEAVARQRDQALGEALKDGTGRCFLAGAEVRHQSRERVAGRHAHETLG
jgi:hypothetical protein